MPTQPKLTDKESIVRLHYITRLVGMRFGGALALTGVLVALRGLAGAVSWNLKIPGLSSSLSNASPGVVILICGTLILIYFRPSSKIEQDANAAKQTSKERISLFKDAGETLEAPPLALGKIVTFRDEKLEAAIRKALEKPEGDLFELELLRLTALSLNSCDVSDLEGIGYCRNLRILAAEYDRVTELSPLLELRQLEILSLNGNPLAELAGDGADLSCLEFLKNLEQLYLGKVGAKHINVLAELPKLKKLGLRVAGH
jgi:Leucine-rich repeat (LRR) protein